MLHVWYIYLHFTKIYRKCIVNIAYLEHVGNLLSDDRPKTRLPAESTLSAIFGYSFSPKQIYKVEAMYQNDLWGG